MTRRFRPFDLFLFGVTLAVLLGLIWWLSSTTPRTGRVVLTTLSVAGGACLVCLPLGTLLAVLLARTNVVGRRPLSLVLLALLLVPLFLQATAWDGGFGRLWSRKQLEPLLGGWWASAWIHGLTSIPWVALLVGLGLRNAPPAAEQAALLEGTGWQVFRRVSLAYALPAVLLSAVWVALTVATDMTVTDLYMVDTIARELYNDFAMQVSLSTAWTRAGPWIAAVAWFAGVALYWTGRQARPAQWLRASQLVFDLRRWRWVATLTAWLIVLALVVVPLFNLTYEAGFVVETVDGRLKQSWSGKKVLELVGSTPYRFRDDFYWTFVIGSVTAVTTLLISIPLAWWARRGGWGSLPALVLATAGLAVPAPLIGQTTILLLNRPEFPLLIWLYDRTIAAPALAMTVRCLPLVLLVIWYNLRATPPRSIEAATVDGAGWLSRMRWVVFPQHRRAIFGAALVAMLLVMGELPASILTVPPGAETSAIRIFGRLHQGVVDEVAVICLLMFGGFLALAALAGRLAAARG